MELKVRTHSFAFRVAAIVRFHRVRVEKMLVSHHSAPLARPLAPRVTTWMPDWAGALIDFPSCVLARSSRGKYLKKGIFLPELRPVSEGIGAGDAA
jgi:hypothetical protein